MLASELINELQKMIAFGGDRPVFYIDTDYGFLNTSQTYLTEVTQKIEEEYEEIKIILIS